MATDFSKNAIASSGGFKPSSVDTPIDVRTRIESISDVENIPLPYVGMIFYVIDEDKYYSVKTLKEKTVAGTTKENMLIDTYSDLTTGSSASTSDVPIATINIAGKVKPDGTTITVASDGTISATVQSVDLSNYQTKTDSSLTTTAKTIVGAINEVKATASAGVDSATIASAVNSYMEAHPVSGVIKYPNKNIKLYGDSTTVGYNGATNDMAQYIQSYFGTGVTVIKHGYNGAGSESVIENILKAEEDFSDTIAVVLDTGTNGGITGNSNSSVPQFTNGETLGDALKDGGFTYNGNVIDTIDKYFSLFANDWFGWNARAVEYIKFKNPMCQIYMSVPCISNSNQSGEKVIDTIKGFAEYYAVPIIDCVTQIGVNIRNKKLFLGDYVHGNSLRNEIKGWYQARTIERSLLCPITSSTIATTGISINKTSDSVLSTDTSYRLFAYVEPYNASDKTVTWSSSVEGVATINEYGVITPVSVGQTTITATQGSFSATCTISIVDASNIPVTSISFANETESIAVNNSLQLNYTILPTTATNKNVTWSSNATGIATVTDGVVTGIATGDAIITVTTEDGSFSDTVTVTVTEASSSDVSVTDISLNKSTMTIEVGDTGVLTATIMPDNATNKNVIWASNKTDIATVLNGVVTGVAVGTATITATTESGNKVATCEVTVTDGLTITTFANLSLGEINSTTGEVVSSANRVVTDDFYPIESNKIYSLVKCGTSYNNAYVAYYDASGNFISKPGSLSGANYRFQVPDNSLITQAKFELIGTGTTANGFGYTQVGSLYDTEVADMSTGTATIKYSPYKGLNQKYASLEYTNVSGATMSKLLAIDTTKTYYISFLNDSDTPISCQFRATYIKENGDVISNVNTGSASTGYQVDSTVENAAYIRIWCTTTGTTKFRIAEI